MQNVLPCGRGLSVVKISVFVEGTLLGALGVLAFLDSSHTIQIFGSDIPGFALLMAIILGLALPLRRDVQERRLARRLFMLFSFVLSYAGLTIFLSDRTFSAELGYPLILAFLAMIVPYKLTGLIRSVRLKPRQSIFRFSLVITLSMIIYAVKRQMDPSVSSQLESPLGGAAVVHVALLLTLAAYFACAKSGYRRGPALVLVALTIGLIILTGSRAGLASALLLSSFMVLGMRRPGRSIVALVFIGSVFVALLRVLPTDRFSSFNDEGRGVNTSTGLHFLTDSVNNLIFGVGSGRVWPWYKYEEGALAFDRVSHFAYTQFGYLLTNPHSVFLGTIVELGLIGFIPMSLMFVAIFREYVRIRHLPGNDFVSILFLGILCSLPSFLVDYYLYKNFPTTFIWWYFVFFALTLSAQTYSHLDGPSAQQTEHGQRFADAGSDEGGKQVQPPLTGIGFEAASGVKKPSGSSQVTD
jgi:O-Antigen ligase